MLSIEGQQLKVYCPDAAVDLWWVAKTRCIQHNQQKKYKKRAQAGQSSAETSNEDYLLLSRLLTYLKTIYYLLLTAVHT